MKYLLIFLSLFPTYSFLVEFYEKSIPCKFYLTEQESKNIIISLITFNQTHSIQHYLRKNEIKNV